MINRTPVLAGGGTARRFTGGCQGNLIESMNFISILFSVLSGIR
jgi:hypothetical protein